jgi:hypothetical protein
MNGLSSVVPIIPLGVAAIAGLIFHGQGNPPSTLEVVVIAFLTFSLFAIWGWRVYLGAKRQVRRIRSGDADE